MSHACMRHTAAPHALPKGGAFLSIADLPGGGYLTRTQVAELFPIPYSTLAKLRRGADAVPHIRVGRRVYYKIADVVAYLDARRVVSGGEG